MSIDQRLSRLAPALTAQERAILILEAWKDGKPEDPAWRRYMPQEQSNAFNHYIELMNQANVVLGKVIGVLHMQAEMLEQREAWLVSLTLWQEHIEEIRRAVRLSVKEPITESEHQAAVEAARNRWVPVGELAEFLAGQRDYSDDDYEEVEDRGAEIKDEVWDRAVAEEGKRLRALVAEGKVEVRGKGKAMKFRQSALSHFGHEVGAASEDYLSYRVVHDDQAEEVEVERELLRGLHRVINWQHFEGPDSEELAGMPERMCIGLRETTACRLISTWVQVRCVDVLVGESSDSFNGIDPLRPVFRDKLEGTRQKLIAVKERLGFLNMEVAFREPLEEELAEVRSWVDTTAA
jgi:hypothetical protein